MTFRERFMAGEAEFDEIFDLTDEWNMSDDTITLREYLGLTVEEEDIWVSDSDEALEEFMIRERTRKIFFADLDGTLLNDQKQITPAMRAVLNDIRSAGHLIVITTGRVLPSALRQAKKLGLDAPGCYIICCNGGQIYDPSRREFLHADSVSIPLVKKCVDAARENGIFIQSYTHDDVIADEDNDELRAYCSLQDLPWKIVPDLTEALVSCPPPKLLAIDTKEPGRLVGFRDHLQEIVGDELNLFLSNPWYLEIVPKGTDKGAAVRKVCDILGVPVERTLSAGDADNDIPMLKAAGTGVAMKNAFDTVKAAADIVTEEDNNHDGLLPILRKFFLEK